jgi:hypothetical protein
MREREETRPFATKRTVELNNLFLVWVTSVFISGVSRQQCLVFTLQWFKVLRSRDVRDVINEVKFHVTYVTSSTKLSAMLRMSKQIYDNVFSRAFSNFPRFFSKVGNDVTSLFIVNEACALRHFRFVVSSRMSNHYGCVNVYFIQFYSFHW